MAIEQNDENNQGDNIPYVAPDTNYHKTRAEFDVTVGRDFITHANQITGNNQDFLVGLAHGQSPSGAYEYILENFHEIQNPNLLRFTATNSHLRRQRDLKSKGIFDAIEFLKELLQREYISKKQIIGKTV